MTRRFRFALPMVLAALCCALAHAEPVHLIICGSGGDPEFSAKFHASGTRLREVLHTQSPRNSGRIVLMTEAPVPDQDIRPSTLDSIRATFHELAQSCSSQDDLFLYLIGHGSFRANVSKFNIPGPDLAAEDLDALLDSLPVARICVLVGSSASAGFINVLSAPNRIICTATKSTDERNATRFMGHFIDALADGTADLDKDERISVLEACTQAAVLTEAWYKSEGLIASEHALIDDNGDGLGVRMPLDPDPADPERMDGQFARAMLIRDYPFPPDIPETLIAAYQDALKAVEDLKALKSTLPEDEYYPRLRDALLKAAQANRAIRQFPQPNPE